MTTYYVAQSSAGSGDGSSYANRMSVAAHNARIFSAGDTIYLCDTINSRVEIPSSGASGNRITYRGDYSGHAGVLTASSSGGALKGITKDHLTIDGLEIKNGTIGITFLNNCNYITIKRCTIHDMKNAGSKGILISSDATPKKRNSNIIIGGAPGDGNEIYNVGVDTGGADINTAHMDGFIVSYNKCYGGNADTGIDGMGDMLSDDGLIEYNEFYDHKKSIGPEYGEDGLDLKGSSNVIVRYNHIYGNRVNGIGFNEPYVEAGAHCHDISIHHNCIHDNIKGTCINIRYLLSTAHIYNNILYNSGYHGISCFTESWGNVWIYNNTIINCHGQADDRFAILITTGSNYYVKNNILYSDTHNDLIYVASASNVNLDYNSYYYTGGAARLYWNGAYKTLSEIQALGQEINGSEGDPGLTNVETDDYTLASGSACINTGANLGATYDDALNPHTTDFTTSPPTVNTMDQDSHGTGWEIGAYVYGAAATPAKGSIVNLDYPVSVKHGAAVDINAATKNIGELSGLFKMQIFIDAVLKATSPLFTLAAGATSTDKIAPFIAPATGASMAIDIKCIRVTS